MSAPKIKICGLTRPEDIDAANELLCDYIGFVFAPRSRRALTEDAAAKLKARLDGRIKAVGVFVNAPPEQIAGLLRAGVIDIAQLHGTEDEAYIARLRALCAPEGCELIQAFRVETERDIERAVQSTAEHILLDHGAGGTGERFDWALCSNVTRPFFLAGGLGPENAAEAARAAHPYALDVSSGVETDGKKDPEKMKEFVRAVRGV